MRLLEPKEFVINGTKYMLSKFPAVGGREIIYEYELMAAQKSQDYQRHERIMFKLMRFVGKVIEGRAEPLLLETPELIDNHVKNWAILVKLETEMLNYNNNKDVFQDGRDS